MPNVLTTDNRIFWRMRAGIRFDNPKTFAWRMAAGIHLLLYALVLSTLALGVANAWVRGNDLFGLGHIPKFGNYDAAARHSLANAVVGWHRLAANAVLLLAGGHALVGLAHHYVAKDDVLRRMVP